MAETRDADVMIVGGGPVGLVIAIELGRRGIGCVLLNDAPSTATHPKANAIGARSMEHFRRLGIAAPIRAAGLDDDHPTDVSYFTSLTGIELARLRLPTRVEALRQARAGEGPWGASPEPPHRCSQIFLEQALRRRASELPSVELRFGWKHLSFREEAEGVIAEAEEVATGKSLTVRARYLVGCDGGASAVRRQLGIAYAGEHGVERRMMGGSMHSAYFRVKADKSWLSVGRSWQYWCFNPAISALIIHVDSHEQFLAQIRVPEGIDHKNVDSRNLVERAARAPVPLQIVSVQPWLAGHALVATSYGGGRMWLAGDSAHLFTPTGGLGMNTGVDDAVNLAWKLAAMLEGWGGERLLASYEAERRPIGARNIAFARDYAISISDIAVTPEIEKDTAAGRAERARVGPRFAEHAFREFVIPGVQLGLSYAASPIVAPDGTTPPTDTPNVYTPSACPGLRAPHLWLGEQALFDRCGIGFTLLRMGSSDGAEIIEAAKSRTVPLTVLDVKEARELYDADLALIRPDQHVAWRGNRTPTDALGLIDRVRGA
jgi:2-polyprenyl-6-methoxyphenol hydroxylase-like FAD-dependent oxidoreductase